MANEEVTTSLNVDITQFKKGLSDANRYIRMANSEFDKATAGVDKWSDSTEGLRAKLTQLNKTLEGQEAAAAVLRHEYERVVAEQGESSKGAQELAIKLNKQEAACKKTAAQIKKYEGDLQEAENTTQETEKATGEMSGAFAKAAGAAGKLVKSLAGLAGRSIITGIKGIAAASAGLVTAFLATGETSKEWIANMNKLDAVAQDSGRSTQAVRKQFEEFYGILGDETAATTTASNLEAIGLSEKNLASVTNSMAGIWAKYGDSIPLDGLAEAILHSSALGSTQGTLADAIEWAGISTEEFDKKLEACSSEQERQQLIVDTLNGLYGELGNTYKEQNAAVIESNKATAALQTALAGVGEASMPVMSALKNMGASILTDLLPHIKTLGESFRGALDGSKKAASEMGNAVGAILQNLGQKVVDALPTILTVGGSIVSSLVQGIISAAPSLAAGVGQIVQYFVTAAPKMLSAGAAMIAQLLQGLAGAMPSIIQQAGTLISSIVGALKTNLPQILAAGGEVVHQLLAGIVNNLPAIAQGAMDAIGGFVQGIQTYLPIILSKGSELLGKLGEGIRTGLPDLVSQALDIIMNFATTLYDNAPKLIETGFDLLGDLVQGIMNALPALIAKGPEIISKFANIINDNFPKILAKGVQLIGQIIKGIISAIPTLIANIPKIITAIVDVWEAFNWLQLGKKAITWLKDGVLKMVGAVKSAGKNIFDAIMNAIKALPQKLLSLGKTAISNMKNGITSMVGAVKSAGTNILNAVVNIIKALPGKLLTFGKNAISKLGSAIGSGVGTIKSKAKSIFDSFVNGLKDLPSKMVQIGKDAIGGIINGIGAMVGKLYDSIKNALGGLVEKGKKALGIASPSKVLADEIGKWIPAGIGEGIVKNTKSAVKAMAKSTKQILGAANSELSGTSLKMPGVKTTGNGTGTGGQGGNVYNFYQTNNSPKALSRAEIYRQTKNQLRFATANA